MKKVLVWSIVIAMLLGTGAWVVGFGKKSPNAQPAPAVQDHPAIGMDLSGNEIITLDGRRVRFTYDGLQVLYLWDPYQAASQNGLMQLQAFRAELEEKNVRLLGLLIGAYEEGVTKTARSVLKDYDAPFAQCMPDKAVRDTLLSEVEEYPAVVLVNESGTVLDVRGNIDETSLSFTAWVDTYLSEDNTSPEE